MRRFIVALAMLGPAALPGLAANFEERVAPCLACHGEKGQSENPEVPSLGAQPANFTLIQLYLFREKRRQVEPMTEYAKDLTDDDLRTFSDFIARLPAPKPVEGQAEPARMDRGRALIQKHRCNFCHNVDFSGHEHVPRLAAQREDYLVKALRDYKSSARIGYEPTMLEVMGPLGNADILDLAYVIARLP